MAMDSKKKVQATDPLEAAKIPVKPPPEPSPPKPPVKVFKPEAAVQPPPPPSAAKKYRVMRTTTVSLSGNIVRLNEGDIVSESSYGPDHMQRIRESGVQLAEL